MPERDRDVASWLRGLGLERYAAAFEAAEITPEILPELTDKDLRELDLPLGPRKTLLKAIRSLNGASALSGADVQGHDAPAGRSPSEALRRQLTVLFVDLVGSTALSARLDPEEMREVLHGYQEAVGDEIRRFEGHVAKLMGDGVLAYFGFPQAHEDDAERAVHAGLAVLAAVTRLRTPLGERLAARAGIATGLVVVGDLVGHGAAQEQAVIGETPNLAARLQELAEPGSLVIASGTRRLLGPRFAYADLGTHVIRGLPAPVPAWRVLGPSRTAGRFEAREAAAGLSPLVGRGEELRFLLHRWRLAKGGEGQAVLLSGEPGIGKSRLLRALREQLADEAHAALVCQSSPYHSGTALHPVIDHLERTAGFERGDRPEDKLARLEGLLARLGAEEAAPLLAALLAIPSGGRHPDPDATPQRRKELTLQALLGMLASQAAQGPVLAVLEDAHWADATTLELFGRVIDQVPRMPVLVVVTFRPELAPPWADRPHLARLALSRLSQNEVTTLIRRVSGGPPLPAQVKDQILAKTDGVPLFVEELTKAVLETGPLELAGDRYVLRGGLQDLDIPDTLQGSLLARLDRLPSVRKVAQIAACIGREFTYDLLAGVASGTVADLDRALKALVQAELIFQRGDPPAAAYAFKHALVRDTAYQSLLKSRRQQLHARIAEVLEKGFPRVAAAQPEVLARHCAEGGLVAKAVAYRLAAGRLAARRSAMAEAVAQLTAGLELLATLPAGRDRSRTELDLQLALGLAFNATRGWASPEMGRAYARARELCREVDDQRLLTSALHGLWAFHVNRAEMDAALEHAQDLLRLTEAEADGADAMLAHRAAGIVLLFRGELGPAAAHFEQITAKYDRGQHALPLFVPHDTGVVGRIFLALVGQLRGRPETALAVNREGMNLAREVAQPLTSAFALHVGCIFHQLRGERDGVEALSTALVTLAMEQGFPHFVGTGTFFRGWAMAAGGAFEAGIELMREGLAAKRATGAEIKVPYYLGLLAATEAAAGRSAAALPLLEDALEKAEATGERWFLAELWRLKGETLRQLQDCGEAQACLERALAVAAAQGAAWWQQRAAASLARARVKRPGSRP